MNFNKTEIQLFIKYYKYFILLRNILSNYHKTNIKNIKLESIKIENYAITYSSNLNIIYKINTLLVNIILQITPGIFLYHISGFNDKNYDNINLVKNNYIVSNYSITKNKKYFILEFKISNKQKKIFRKFFFTKNLDLINIYYLRQTALRICIKTNRTIGPFYEALSYNYSYLYYEYSYITKILI